MKTREIKVTSRNQITIPWDIRSIAKWFKPHAKLKVILVDKDTIVLKPVQAKPLKIKIKKVSKLKKKNTFGNFLMYKGELAPTFWDEKKKK